MDRRPTPGWQSRMHTEWIDQQDTPPDDNGGLDSVIRSTKANKLMHSTQILVVDHAQTQGTDTQLQYQTKESTVFMTHVEGASRDSYGNRQRILQSKPGLRALVDVLRGTLDK